MAASKCSDGQKPVLAFGPGTDSGPPGGLQQGRVVWPLLLPLETAVSIAASEAASAGDSGVASCKQASGRSCHP